ncbi:hypothetical protein I4U23_015064 [Adineta vaga]|nr:hypothetical protein I4U23_015064 [Adineta vaga]
MTHVCNVRVNEKEDAMDYVERLFKEISVQDQEPIDYQCLQKYKKTNKHFNMTMIIEEGLHVAYQCAYHYKTHEIKLNYDLVTETWEIESDKYEMEKTTYLNTILIDLEYLQQHDNLTLDQQIQFIIKEFDCYFLGLEFLRIYNGKFIYQEGHKDDIATRDESIA